MDTANLTTSSSPSHPTISGTAPIKSPSDLSYTSSGASPSHSSSRNTSPDSLTVTPSPSQQSALVDLASTAELHCNPSSLSEQHHRMDRNPFQSINERRTKIITDRTNTNTNTNGTQIQQTQTSPQQQNFPTQALRSNMPQLTISSRGLASSNWRSQAAADEAYSSRGSSGEYTPFDSSPTPLSMTMNPHSSATLRQQSQQISYMSPRMEQFPQQHQLDFMTGSSNPNTGIMAVSGTGMGSSTGTGMNASMIAGTGVGAGAGEGAPATTTGLHFPKMQTESIYAYCFDRGNGQYTRLVPVDMLPPLKDVPALQQGNAGMMILPLPLGRPPNGRSSNTEAVSLKSPPHTPSSPSDTIQSRIDNIVASTPPTPPHHHQPSLSLSSGGSGLGISASGSTATALAAASGAHGHAHSYSLPQHFDGGHGRGGQGGHSHSNPNHNSSGHGGQSNAGGGGSGGGGGAGGQQPQRRPKIYCDKWVHEGVCAFTQQGCKYKHEMPFDKVTQHALGLFHGFPAWWKKHQADLSRQREGPGPAPGAGIAAALGDGAQELTGLSASRFMSRGGAPGPGAAPSSAGVGVGFVEGKADGAGLASSPTAPGLPSWRRSGEHHSSEQKSLGTGRGMTRGVGSGMRNPIVSYGSPFGPIAPPARTFSTGPSGASYSMTDPANHSQANDAGGSSRARSGSGGGLLAVNPYSSLESLDENSTGAGNGAEEAMGETSHSSGARLS
ncbi:hypothetical protein F4781DRAFT_436423 [Annulohypoxylon bovei var. microspora]|nr:hypothetical protein F4781DRAFT_436423 [Annulohypoxylon bovei var. microspora]